MRPLDFFGSFPSLELLQSRHSFIPDLCNNRPVVYSPMDYMSGF